MYVADVNYRSDIDPTSHQLFVHDLASEAAELQYFQPFKSRNPEP